jgi:hypothetical protein
MGATTTPAFHAMSIDELEQVRTALEIKITSIDTADRTWILGRFDELLDAVKTDDPTAVTIDRTQLEAKLAPVVDYDARDWVLALFDELTARVDADATAASG